MDASKEAEDKEARNKSGWGRRLFPPLAVFLFAFALYLFRLDAQSLWYDEAVSARLARMPLPDLIRWTANDIQPPLYYVLLHAWTAVTGTSEWALRFFSAWWGTWVVVLGYTLARQLTGSRGAGVTAALLFTLAPWNLYYSQEARMYTMLVALGMAWTLVAIKESRPGASTVLLSGLGLALLYTHYFALFLLIALTLALLLLDFWSRFWTTGEDRAHITTSHLSSLLFAWAVILGGYVPWLPFLITRFREDASYWRGTLKLGEALRHWWVHMTLGAPETFLEKDAVRWLPFFLALTLIALLHILVSLLRGRKRTGIRLLTLILTWLLLPPFLILALAYRSPKFNPRYLMIAYPAWILLLVTGWPPSSPVPHASRPTHYALRITHYALLVTLYSLLLPFARADWAWFTDPAFTKPDFRGAIAYIRQHRQPDEPVLLISGHMSPVFDYYAPHIPRLRLPDIDVLDVNRVLDFGVARDINQGIAGRSGVWLLLWQNEVVDPMGVVPYLLARVGREDTTVPNAFWHVRVRHFRLPAGARLPETPPIDHPLHANWENTVTLIGHARQGETIALFFRPLRRVESDLYLHMEVWDEEGFLWGKADVRPAGYLYPTFRWQPGTVVFGQHRLPVIPGTPAGTYTLRLRLYDSAHPSGLDVLDSAGNPMGKDVVLPDLPLIKTHPAPTATETFPPLPPGVDEREVVTFTLPTRGDMSIPAAMRVWPRPPWEPGRRLYVQLRWRTSRPPSPEDKFYLLLLRGETRVPLAHSRLAATSSGEENWPAGGVVFSQVRTRVPRSAEPGRWTLAVQAYRPGRDVSTVWRVAEAEIIPSRRNFQVPAVAIPVNATFGDTLRLVGVDMNPATLRPAATVPITLTWQSLQEVDVSYTAFVHLLGPDGRVIAQEDHVPCRGACPTDGWLAGEVVQDRYEIALPDTLPDGPLTLEVGLYDAAQPGYPRLPITAGAFAGQDVVRLREGDWRNK